MIPISLIVPIMETEYSEIMTLNIKYYVQHAICLNQNTQTNIWLTIFEYE